MSEEGTRLLGRLHVLCRQWNEAEEYLLRALAMMVGLSERLAILLPPNRSETYDFFADEQRGLPAFQSFPELSTLLIGSHTKSFDRNHRKLRQQL
jgi:hypothetical protein